MCYVDDLINGTILAMENENAVGEVINIGSDEELSVLETAILIHQIADSGTELKLKFVPMNKVFGDYKEISRRRPDLSKARNILGYNPTVSLKDGLKKTIAGYKAHMKFLKVDFSQLTSTVYEADINSKLEVQQHLLKRQGVN